MEAEPLQAIKERCENIPEGWTMGESIKIIGQMQQDASTLITEVERLQKELELTEKCYEICERGMFKANDMFIETNNKLDQVELAEAKMRMENERLREVLKQVLEDEAPNCDGYETFIHATARKALDVRP
ncbi:hypothetical protein AAGS61_05790 [Lysinibacillus sp. KU-BSD001]|uniref:hypothetical protein n=1 Tax=Lysinibacillus sp. KU-BSD001 TaxID=3141328 RepID=UPI0036EA795E